MTAHGDVFDMGIATRQALTKYAKGTPPLECGGTGTYDNGNGSLMRILPLAFYLHRTMGPEFPSKSEACQIIHNASALTHAHPISLIACDIYCSIANELLCGRRHPADIQHGITAAKEMCASLTDTAPYLDTFQRVDMDVLQSLPKSEISGSGYVVHTLEAALWCLLHTDSYRACVLEAVNLGGGYRHGGRCGRWTGRDSIWRGGYPGGMALRPCETQRDRSPLPNFCPKSVKSCTAASRCSFSVSHFLNSSADFSFPIALADIVPRLVIEVCVIVGDSVTDP